jgi:hypothetical protein
MKFDIFNPPPKLNLAAYRPRYAVCAIDPVEQRARHLATYANPADRIEALKVAMQDAARARAT